MRKFFSFLMSVAVAATTFVGCTNTEINIDSTPTPTPTGTYHQLTFAADSESDASRTHHTGETIHWSKGDRIRIGYTREGVWQNAEGNNSTESAVTAKLYASSEAHEDAELAKFRVTILFKDTELEGEHIFYGLYPSEITKNNAPDFADSETGTINVYLPYIQSPTATSFDPKADLLVSKSLHTYDRLPIATKENAETGTPEREGEEISMRWKRLVAHGQITLKNLLDAGMVEGEKISFVEFTVDDGVNLTGDFILDIAGKTITPNGSKNKVRLSFAENEEYNTLVNADEDDVADDFVVWFATAPFTFTEINVEIGTDRAIYTRKITITGTNKEFKVNTRSTLGINMGLPDTTREPLPAWELLTDVNNLAVGNFVVIAAADSDVAMSTTQNNNNRGQAAITKSGTSITIGSDVQVLKIEAGTVDGTWAFKDEITPGYLCAASSSNNYLRTQTKNDENSSWTIEVTDAGIATVKAQGNYTRNWMRYNSTSSIFASYGSGQQDISIYYISALPTTLGTPVILTASEVEAKSVLVEWSETEGAIYYTVICSNTENSVVKVFKNITDTSIIADGLSNSEWSITVTAHDGRYGATTSEPKTVTVTGIDPSVAIDPVSHTFNWKGGDFVFNITLNNLGETITLTPTSSDENAFSIKEISDVTVSSNKKATATVTITAGENNSNTPLSGTITIKATGSTIVSNSISVSQEAKPEGERTYTKIDKYLADFSGQYLIVYEGNENHTSVAFDGSLAELDAAGNNKSVTITDGTITLSAAEDLFYFTIEKVEGGYTIKSSNANGHYIGQTANDNGMATGTDAYINTISYSNEGIVIKASSATATYLRYNYTDSETGKRFRYYKSGQQPIQLYRLEGTGNDATLTQLATPTNVEAEVDVNTIYVTWTTVHNADSYTVTCGTASKTVTGTSAEFTDLEYETKYDITVVANPAANSTEYYASEPGTASVTTGEDPNAGGNTGGDETTTVTDYIDAPLTGATGTSYITWSGKTSNSSAVYAGKSATKSKNQEYVQLNSSNPNGIITTASGGKVSKIIVTWDASTTDGRTLDIYGKNEAYTSSSELYDSSKQGTKLGSIVEATSTELTIDGDYSYIGLRSKSGAMYITQIQIVWVTSGNAGGGDTPATPTQLTMSSVSCTEQTENSLTFSWSAVTGATGYKVSTDGGTSYSATQTETTYTWNGLSASTTKTLYVKAIGDGVNYTDSDAKSASGTTTAASGSGDATGTVTIAFSSVLSSGEKVGSNTYTSNGVTIKFTKVNNSGSYYDGSVLRLYQGDLMTITGAGAMKQIVITTSGGKNGPFSVDTGSITVSSSTKHTWTGNATSVTFTATAQARFASIEITY